MKKKILDITFPTHTPGMVQSSQGVVMAHDYVQVQEVVSTRSMAAIRGRGDKGSWGQWPPESAG